MSENVMRYKNYLARVQYSPEDECFVGRVLGIRDVVGFHGESVAELKRDFRETMEFYFDTCRKEGKEPDRPYSGRLFLRIPPELHRRVAMASETRGKSINDFICDALQKSGADGDAAERLQSGEEIVPFTEIEAQLERRARSRAGAGDMA